MIFSKKKETPLPPVQNKMNSIFTMKFVVPYFHMFDNEGNPTGVLDINASLAEFGNSVNGEYTSPKGKTFTIVLSES